MHEAIPLQVSYSRSAVAALVARVRKSVDRPPRDAAVAPSGSGLTRGSSRTGVALQTSWLERRLDRALSTPGARRLIVARTKIVEPAVTTSELADKYPWYIVVNRGAFRLTVYDHLRVRKAYTIAVGQAGLETPAGLYHVQDKQVDPSWQVPNKARWLGIYNGAGIHGTDVLSSLGTAASHGCIRMAIPDVIEVYDEVPLGAPVYIA